MEPTNLPEGLDPSLLNDGSFSSFLASIDSSLLENERFIDALNSIDRDLITDGNFTALLSARGPQIVLDGSFIEFTTAINRSLLSDGSFTTFLNTVETDVLTNGNFTETLVSLGEEVLSSGNFTEALVRINNIDEVERNEGVEFTYLTPEPLTDENLQGVIRRIDPNLLIDGTFERVFVDDFLIDFINEFDVDDDGDLRFRRDDNFSAQEVVDAALDVLSPLGDVGFDDLLNVTGGDGSVVGESPFDGNGFFSSSSALSESTEMTASVDAAVQDFISMDSGLAQFSSIGIGTSNGADTDMGDRISGNELLVDTGLPANDSQSADIL